MTRALLLGAYGQTNLGDDLLLYNYLDFLKQKGITDVHASASNPALVPASITKTFPGLQLFATYKTSFWQLLQLMRSADYIFYGGGTVYKELYSSTGRSPYSVIAPIMAFNILAKLLGKKVVGLHIGIGTIKTSLGRAITKSALAACTHTTFRDAESYAYARDVLGLPQKNIEASTDGLFLNQRWREAWLPAKIPVPRGRKIVGINMLSDIPDWVDRQKYLQTMGDFAQSLVDQNYFVVFLPFQTDFTNHNDRLFLETEVIPYLKKSADVVVADDTDITTITSYLQHIDVLVGMRFHSLLLAAAVGTPFLAVAYDTKCWRFVSEAGYEHAVKIEELSAETLQTTFSELTKNLAPARAALTKIADDNFKAAKLWIKNHPL